MMHKSAPPSAASAATDAESGQEGASRRADLQADLRALEAMHKRGLIPTPLYTTRRANLLEKLESL